MSCKACCSCGACCGCILALSEGAALPLSRRQASSLLHGRLTCTQPAGPRPPGFTLHCRTEGFVSGLLITPQDGIEYEGQAGVSVSGGGMNNDDDDEGEEEGAREEGNHSGGLDEAAVGDSDAASGAGAGSSSENQARPAAISVITSEHRRELGQQGRVHCMSSPSAADPPLPWPLLSGGEYGDRMLPGLLEDVLGTARFIMEGGMLALVSAERTVMRAGLHRPS